MDNIILDIKELDNYDLPVDKFFKLTINYDIIKIELLMRISSLNKNLICFGSGAYNPDVLKPPIFNRFSWQEDFEESVIFYNDPTLYVNSKLTLGCGVGKNDDWYLKKVYNVIKIIVEKININNENILFFGSSGGGFTSIQLATLFKNSAAIVNNPIIFLERYNKIAINNILDYCFEESDKEAILNKFKYRFDILDLFEKENYIPSITYLLNLNSQYDVRNQFMPFLTGLESLKLFENEQLNVLIYSGEAGHAGVLDKDETVDLLKKHFEKQN
jgi:hypothetical protein